MIQSSQDLISLATDLASGRLNLMEHLTRLEALIQEREPVLKAFLPEEGRFSRLKREARGLLDRYPHPERRPSLFGVPIGVKDIFRVDGFKTAAGSKLPVEEFDGLEAEVVSILKEAGALILGKTVTTEFAYFSPGPTTNPVNKDYTPGGSSSGSAAAVGAGLCALSLGSQTIGSINRPAAFCGVVGFKPSYDRISKTGIIPLSPSLDHVGFFTVNASSAVWAASIMIPDWQSAAPNVQPRLGIPEGPYLEKAYPDGLENFQKTVARLLDKGFRVIKREVMSDFEAVAERHQLILAAEAARVHSDWFKQYEALYHEKTAGLIRQGQSISAEILQAVLPSRAKLRKELTTVMEEEGIDVWIAPAAKGTAPYGLQSTGDPIMNLPWTHSGLPTISLPSGINKVGLPFGLQVIGKWYDDEHVLAWASKIERALAN